jgi:hypothetical protein
MFHTWLRRWAKRNNRSRSPGSSRRRPIRGPLYLEPLEDRTLLSCFSTLATDLGNDLKTFDNGLNGFLDAAAKVPFLDGQPALLDAKSFVETFRSKLQTTLSGFSDNAAASDVQKALFDLLGPKAGGLNVLGDTNNDGTVDPNDVEVSISGTDPSNCKIGIEMRLHQDVAVVQTPNLKFGLGLPALPFQVTAAGGVQLKVGFDYELKFGYDATQNTPFYFEPSGTALNIPPNLDPYHVSGHEFAVEAQASLVNFSAGLNVGFLGGTAKDTGDNSNQDPSKHTELVAAFVIDDVNNPQNVSVLGEADVNLALTLGVTDGNGGPLDANFPSVGTNFALHWDLTNNAPPTVAFNDVTLSLGALFSHVISPQLLTYVQDFTKPLQPLFDVLKARLPVLSDLAGQKETLESLLKAGASLNLFGPYSALVGLATNLVDITSFVNQISTSGNQLMIDVGNFTLGGANEDLRSEPAAPADIAAALQADPNAVLTSWTPNASDAPDLATVADGIKSQLDKIASNNPGLQGVVSAAEKLLPSNVASFNLSFPFFDDPANGIFKILLGQDTDLMSFTARFKMAAPFGLQSLGIPGLFPLSCDFSSEIDVDAYFKAAYDTYGVRQFIHDALNGSINVGDLANGFYLATDDSNNPDHPNGCHLNLSGGIKAVPELNLVFFQAGVDASISADLHLWATDPGGTGKFRLNDLQNAADLFNANGDVEASLTSFTKVGVDVPLVGFVGTENDYDIARTKLIDFGTSSVTVNPYKPPPDLELAARDPSDPSRLLLNMGQRAPDLTTDPALAGQKDVSFTVSHVSGDRSDEVLQVSAFGFQQQFGGEASLPLIKTIVVQGADGNDVITIDPGVLADADITEGNGNVQVQYQGSGNARVIAGNGNDLLQGGTGYNYFRTGSGSSNLIGGDGSTATVPPPPSWGQATTANGTPFVNDLETGAGSGTNTLHGGHGTNHLVAIGSGSNQLFAGDQNDYLATGLGTNTVTAGAGQDTVGLFGGTNTVVWQVGDGNLAVSTGPEVSSTNALEVSGSDQDDTFTLGPNPSDPTGRGVQVLANQAQANAAQITWAGYVQKVSIDGGKGNDTTTVNDLSGTTVQDVGLNDGEALAPDGGQDVVNVEGSPNAHTITVATEKAFLHPDPPLVGGVMLVQTTPQYKVHVAVTNHEDTLNVYAKGSGNTINVQSNTGHTVIHADAGSDTFNVSSDAPTDAGVLLDHPTSLQNRPPFGLFGQLDLHAGPGANTLTVSEGGSSEGDHVIITDASISGGPLHSSDPTTNPATPVVLNPYEINYDTTGTFGGGITVRTGSAADTVDVQSLPANAPTRVLTGGGGDQVNVGDAGNTLDSIRSPLTVNGGDGRAALVFNDQGAAGAESYLVGFSPIVGDFLVRGSQSIVYLNVGSMVLNAGNHGNQIDVRAVVGAATTINAGNGSNTIDVGDKGNGFRLGVDQQLIIHGQQGTNQLDLNDQGTGAAVDYTLTAGTFLRTGLAPVLYDGVQSLLLQGGSGNDRYDLLSAAAGSNDKVGGGAGNDTFDVAVTPADAANLSIDGGGGSNVLNVVEQTGAGKVAVHPDVAPPTSGGVTVTYPNGGPTVTISYQNISQVSAVSDLAGRVHATLVQLVHKPLSKLYQGLLRITNVSAAPVQGPIRIVLDGLSPLVTLFKVRYKGNLLAIHYTAAGEPYFSVPVGTLKHGKKLFVELDFWDPSLTPIHFFAHPYSEG